MSLADAGRGKHFFRRVLESAKYNRVPLGATGVFLLALALRLWGTNFGLPNLYHPDEWAIVDRSLAMLRTGDYNPRDFVYPSLYMYMELANFILYFFYGVSKGLYMNVSDLGGSNVYLWGRYLTAVLGALTVYVTYLTGKELFGTKGGLIGALFLAVSFLHLRDSHYITVDVPAVFFVSLSLFFAARILQGGGVFEFAMSGLFAGMAAATKWNAFPVAFSFVTAYIVSSSEKGRWDGKIFYGFLFTAVGLFIGTPYAFLDLPIFLNTLGSVLIHYRGGHPGFEASRPYLFYLQHLFSSEGMGPTIALASGVGLLLSLLKQRKQTLFLLAFAFPYFLLISRSAVTFPRNTLPLYSALPLYGGFALAQMYDFLRGRMRERNATVAHAVFYVILVGILILPAIRGIQFGIASAGVDSRTAAAAWIERNIPTGSKIAAEFYGPPISDEYSILKFPFLDHDPKWFVEQGYNYLVFDGADYQRFFDEPEKYAKEVDLYESLFKLGTLIKRFPADKRVEGFLSPEIKIYRLSPLK